MINEIDDMQELYEKYGKDIVDPLVKGFEMLGPDLMKAAGKIFPAYISYRESTKRYIHETKGYGMDVLEDVLYDIEMSMASVMDSVGDDFKEAIDEFKRFTAGHDDHDRTSDEEKQSADID